MRIGDVLTKRAAETRVMVKQYRFRPFLHSHRSPGSDTWLDSGNLADWLGDAIARVEWVVADAAGSIELNPIDTRIEAYLDGDLIGEIRDDGRGHTYYAFT